MSVLRCAWQADSEKGKGGGKGKVSIQHDSERKDKRKITLKRNRLHYSRQARRVGACEMASCC